MMWSWRWRGEGTWRDVPGIGRDNRCVRDWGEIDETVEAAGVGGCEVD